MTIRAVSVDVHGTLILPRDRIGTVYAAFCQRHGIAGDPEVLDREFFTAFRYHHGRWGVPYGRDDDDARVFWQAVIRDTIGPTTTQALVDELFEAFGQGATWRILPGALEALALIREAGLPVCGCTNFDGRVRQLLQDHAIELDHLVISAEVGAAKPDPLPLMTVARLVGCAPADLLHIGDNEREDGGAAAAAGCRWLPVDRDRGIDVDRLARLLEAA